MTRVARRLATAVAALALASACSAGTDPAVAESPLVVVLRSVPDPHHAAFMAELRAQRVPLGRGVELVPTSGDEVYAGVDEAELALAELGRAPTVLVAYSTPLAQLAVERFPDTPTVTVVNDPAASELVADPDRPEGEVTGVTFASPADRTLQLAGRLIPGLSRIGYLAPADDPAVEGHRATYRAAAEDLALELVEVTFDGPEGVATAVDELVAAGVDAAVLASANATVAAYDALRDAVTSAGLPIVSNSSRADFVVLALEPDGAEVRRQVARQVARLLDGDPVELVPVEDPRRFRLVVDRGLAEELDLEGLDEALLRQADEVR